jgi:hypothetical protein
MDSTSKCARSVPTTREESSVRMNVQLITLQMKTLKNVSPVLLSAEDVMAQPSVTVKAAETIKSIW